MNELEQINRYIERTKMSNKKRYQMSLAETFAMALAAEDAPGRMVILAFRYGRAKGYRAAKAEVRAMLKKEAQR